MRELRLTKPEIASLWERGVASLPSSSSSSSSSKAAQSLEYKDFVSLCREWIVEILSAKYEGETEWVELYSKQEGVVYLNKRTGAASYEMPDDLVRSFLFIFVEGEYSLIHIHMYVHFFFSFF